MTNDEIETTGPSTWQERIEGEWFGRPSVFGSDGTHKGHIKVNRSSVFDDGQVTYYMHTLLQGGGDLRGRLETERFAFALDDQGVNRIYLGPDFIGAGHPYGGLVDAHYYSPAWQADLRTMVHMPDAETQVYSSLLFDGPTIACVFNGIYKVAFDYETNEVTRSAIDAFCEIEKDKGVRPHALEAKRTGIWEGTLESWGADQLKEGMLDVRITHTPTSLVRADQTVEISGLFDHAYSFSCFRNGNHHTYDGPGMYGNAQGYGRALYTTQHLFHSAVKITGREFLIDDEQTLSVVWKMFDGDKLAHVCFGVLRWSFTD